jgi:hypothetical protein
MGDVLGPMILTTQQTCILREAMVSGKSMWDIAVRFYLHRMRRSTSGPTRSAANTIFSLERKRLVAMARCDPHTAKLTDAARQLAKGVR